MTLEEAEAACHRLEDLVGDYQTITRHGDCVEVLVRYVGDAGGGDVSPATQTQVDGAFYIDEARELGLWAVVVFTDHDTIVLEVRPDFKRKYRCKWPVEAWRHRAC